MIRVRSKITVETPHFNVFAHEAKVDLPAGEGREQIIHNWSILGENLLRRMLEEMTAIEPATIREWNLEFSEYVEWQREGIRKAFDEALKHVYTELDPERMSAEVFADGMMVMKWLTDMRAMMKNTRGRLEVTYDHQPSGID